MVTRCRAGSGKGLSSWKTGAYTLMCRHPRRGVRGEILIHYARASSERSDPIANWWRWTGRQNSARHGGNARFILSPLSRYGVEPGPVWACLPGHRKQSGDMACIEPESFQRTRRVETMTALTGGGPGMVMKVRAACKRQVHQAVRNEKTVTSYWPVCPGKTFEQEDVPGWRIPNLVRWRDAMKD